MDWVTTATAPPLDSRPQSLLARAAACSPSEAMAGPSAGSARTACQMSPPVPARGPISPVPGAATGRAGEDGPSGGITVGACCPGGGGVGGRFRFTSRSPSCTGAGATSAFMAWIARICASISGSRCSRYGLSLGGRYP